ncbi:MAG: glycoside hydrolase family 5 protein [bacterium]|nr:glycoside hydrolase family 5 protein [bacterium]
MAFPGNLYLQDRKVKIRGVQGTPKILMVEQFAFNHFLNDDIFRVLDIFAEAGVNGFRVFGFWSFGRGDEEEPYAKKAGTRDKYHLDRFNDAWFDYQRKWIQYAGDKGIVVLFELFDPCGLKQRLGIAKHHPYYPITGDNPHELSDVNNSRFMGIQQAYARKVLKELSFPNVIWGIMNEFYGTKQWHRDMSKFVRRLAPNNLISGSDQNNPVHNDPNVDIWWVHKGSYNFSTDTPHLHTDLSALSRDVGNKPVYYSTDGFGMSGMSHETPRNLRAIARQALQEGSQMVSFLDHSAYSNAGMQQGVVSQLNVSTYQAMAEVFKPTRVVPFQSDPIVPVKPWPDGLLDLFYTKELKSTLRSQEQREGAKYVDSKEFGFLFFGQYQEGYPTKELHAYFCIKIDDCTRDDSNICILDVYDRQSDRVLGKRVLTRKDFTQANAYELFKFNFTPPTTQARMEFRLFYLAAGAITSNVIAVTDPTQFAPSSYEDIEPYISGSGSGGGDGSGGGGGGGGGETPKEGLIVCNPLSQGSVEISGGTLLGGSFSQRGYSCDSRGGIAFKQELDFSKHLVFEFDLDGNIANIRKGELDGGKVSLLGVSGTSTPLYIQLQRMRWEYKNGGAFRLYFGEKSDKEAQGSTAWCIPNYHMRDWGNESHHLEVHVHNNRCWLVIDTFTSGKASLRYDVQGNRNVSVLLGNRSLNEQNLRQGAITHFLNFRVYYA